MSLHSKAESVDLIYSGPDFFEKAKKLIDESKEVIHLQTYIFSYDETGIEIAEHLMNAAKRGIKVHLLVDGFGSRELPKHFTKKIAASGIQFRFFSRFLSSESISIARRIHHKILVVDKNISLIGGINIGNKYRGTRKELPWFDFAILVKGACNAYIDELCEGIYHKRKITYAPPYQHGQIPINYLINDWFKGKNEIYKNYKKHINSSKESITLIASYFLPGYFFIQRLKNAAKRGVKIKILVGGVSDIAMFHNAEKYLYPYLLRLGFEVYEWSDSVMHGKLALFDDRYLSIGSYNLNNLSKYQCIELNIAIRNDVFCKKVSMELNTLLDAKCKKITKEDLIKQNNFFYRIKAACAYYLYKLLMFLIAPSQ